MLRRARSLAAALSLLVSFALPAHAGVWPNTPYTSVALTNGGNAKLDYQSVADGQGGMFMTWVETGGSTYEVFVQHASATGQPLWGPLGLQITNVAGNQTHPLLVPDGSGGLLVEWSDARSGNTDVYAQRVSAAGTALWTANGVAACNEPSTQNTYFGNASSFPVADGGGGMWVTWSDNRSGNSDVYLQHLSAAGVPQFTSAGVSTGLVVCNATGDQFSPDMASDGAGGVYLAWTDSRTVGNSDIYGSRVTAAGTLVNTSAGNSICTGTGSQSNVRMASDGVGGAILVWLDPRSTTNTALYAARLTPTLFNLWTSNGIAVCDASGSRSYPQIISDGNAGAFVQWLDSRAGNNDLYAAHLNADGTLPWALNGAPLRVSAFINVPINGFSMAADGNGGLWSAVSTTLSGSPMGIYALHLGATGAALIPNGGLLVGTALAGIRTHYVVDTDGNGGLYLTWFDNRLVAVSGQILANKVDRYGNLGSIEPTITSVRDVVGDQGGRVKLTWSASPFDADPGFGIAQYRIWRSAPARAAAAARVARQGTTTDADVASTTGALLLANGYSWEYLGTSPAGALPSYNFLAATTADSVAGSNPRTAFMVEAQSSTTLGAPHWYSAPDSGYSVDNLPPAAPAPLTGQYAAGVTRLHWNPNAEADLAGYRVYRGTSLGFATDAAHLLTAVPDTGAIDVAGAPFVYKVTARDSHGNESLAATLLPTGTTGVGEGPSLGLALAPPSPNPVRASDATRVRFTLPTASRVRVSLLDAQGREMRLLVAATLAAGEHDVAIDGTRAGAAALSPGLYFVRLEAGGKTLMRRMIVLD